MNYYVNPNSEKSIELGTKEYPFRNINLVLNEIYNEHQHTDRNLSIYVMENTDNYLPKNFIQIFNVTKVNIDSYTDNQFYEAQKTNFIIIDSIENINLITKKSLLTLIQNTEKGDLDTSRMSEHEINQLVPQNSTVFHIHRSSLSLNNINIYSEFSDDNNESVNFILTTY